MKKTSLTLAITAASLRAYSVTTPAAISDPVPTASGKLSGVTLKSGVRAFKGVPFGAPPIGDLRWKEPQPSRQVGGCSQGRSVRQRLRAAIAAEPHAEQT
jgi:para-nitrobenzyl esterase